MPATFRHLALNADDVQRAKAFYEARVRLALRPVGAAGLLPGPQRRRRPHRRAAAPAGAEAGRADAGFEATMAVDDIAATMAAIEAAGGRIARPADLHRGRRPAGLLRGHRRQPRRGHAVRRGRAIELRRRLSRPLGRDHLPGRRRGSIATTIPGASSPSATAASCGWSAMRPPGCRRRPAPSGCRPASRTRSSCAARWRPASSTSAPELAEPLPAQPEVLEVAPLLRELILHILKLRMLHPDKPEQDRLARLLIDLLTRRRAASTWRCRCRATAARWRWPSGCRTQPADPRQPRRPRAPRRAPPAHAAAAVPGRDRADAGGLAAEGAADLGRSAALSGGAPASVDRRFDCGYDSPSAFITAFKRQFGVTPGRYPAAREP